MDSHDFVVAKNRTAFRMFDLDGDGYFTRDDHIAMGQRAAEALGYGRDSSEAQDAIGSFLRIWQEIHVPSDTDGDGRVSEEEFLAGALAATPAMAGDTLGRLADHFFEVADRDGNGVLSRTEYGAFVTSMHPSVTSDEVRDGFDHVDADSNGVISRQELRQAFLDYFTSPDPQAGGNWLFGRPTVTA